MEKRDISLTERFIILSRMFIQKYHHMNPSHHHDPFRGQGRILTLLKMEPEMSQKKLSYLLGIRPQSMGELLTKLEQSGYIRRTPSIEDKRAMNIQLTNKGREVADSNEQRRNQELAADEMFQCLNKEEQVTLGNYLDRIIDALKDTLSNDSNEFPEHRPHHHSFDDHRMVFFRPRGEWDYHSKTHPIHSTTTEKNLVESMQNYKSAHEGFTEHYKSTPPWEIGKPQSPFLSVVDQIKSPVLDIGCGTGNTAIFLAKKGHKVTGVDFIEAAIQQARTKAEANGVSVNFLVKDAMTLIDWNKSFTSIIDSGLFHIYTSEKQKHEQSRYVQGLAHVIKPGGKLFLLTFTQEAPEGGVSKQELYDIFNDGWEIESIQQVIGEVNQEFMAKHPELYPEGGPKMWFAVIRRL